MNNKLKLGVIASAIAVATIAGSGVIYAQTESIKDSPNFIQKLAQKLGIGEDRVKTAVDQIRNEKQNEREKAFEEWLSQAVTKGELTEAQKQVILKKRVEMKASMESERAGMANKTPEERKTAMQTKRAELEKWAKDNNIDMKWLMFGGLGKGNMHGVRGWGEKGERI